MFPPFDLPTWTSLATGLYPQNTGVVGDYMYNLRNKQMFNRDDDMASLDGWWTEGEPIWFVNQITKANLKSPQVRGSQARKEGECSQLARLHSSRQEH